MTLKLNIKALGVFTLTSLSSLFLSGCYIPNGTKSITGGSGQSVDAVVGISNGNPLDIFTGGIGEAVPTKFSIEINAVLAGQKPAKDSDVVTYGSINFTDSNLGVMIQGTILGAGSVPLEEIAAAGGYLECSGKFKAPGYVNWTPVRFLVTIAQNPTDTPPGKEELRHIVSVSVNGEDLAEDAGTYLTWFGVFERGNFVFHGDKGVILK